MTLQSLVAVHTAQIFNVAAIRSSDGWPATVVDRHRSWFETTRSAPSPGKMIFAARQATTRAGREGIEVRNVGLDQVISFVTGLLTLRGLWQRFDSTEVRW